MEFTKHKAWVAVGTAVAIAALTALQSAVGDGKLTLQEGITVLLAALGAYGVYKVENKPLTGGYHAKTPDLRREE